MGVDGAGIIEIQLLKSLCHWVLCHATECRADPVVEGPGVCLQTCGKARCCDENRVVRGCKSCKS